MKIKNIDYKIVNGKWNSKRIAKEHGKFSYPCLLIIIEDIKENKVEIPLSYKDIIKMLEKHIWLEKILDWDFFRKGDKYNRKDEIREGCEEADKTDSKIIRTWFSEAKKKGGFKEWNGMN